MHWRFSTNADPARGVGCPQVCHGSSSAEPSGNQVGTGVAPNRPTISIGCGPVLKIWWSRPLGRTTVQSAPKRFHPALTLEVRLQDGFADLVRDGIDVAVRMGELRDSSLVARRIDSQRLLMIASPAYLDRHGTPRRLEDLAGHKAVAFRVPSSGRSRPWQLRQERRIVELHPPHRCNSPTPERWATPRGSASTCASCPTTSCTTSSRAANWSSC